MIDDWIRKVTGKDALVDSCHAVPVEAFKQAYEEYVNVCKTIKNIQKQHTHDNNGLQCEPKILAAFELGRDPNDILERENELLDELIILNQQLRHQQEINTQVRRDIQRVHELHEQYNTDTKITINSDTLKDTINVLKQKQEEYKKIIDTKSNNDIHQLHDIVSLMERHEQLCKELNEFHNLPSDLADALTEIARSEAELQ